ncbi:hypothetical protein HDG35_007158 [Paraburkholderia sp. JPY681]|nr:hypothetical protein [Paraburkholderia atlantica]
MATRVFEAHMLQDRRLRLDMQLFADLFAHTVKLACAARAYPLVIRQVVFDALTRQMRRQRFASRTAPRYFRWVRQAGIGQHEGVCREIIVMRIGGGDLLGFIEHAIAQLLAARREAFALRQAELLLQLGNAFARLTVT